LWLESNHRIPLQEGTTIATSLVVFRTVDRGLQVGEDWSRFGAFSVENDKASSTRGKHRCPLASVYPNEFVLLYTLVCVVLFGIGIQTSFSVILRVFRTAQFRHPVRPLLFPFCASRRGGDGWPGSDCHGRHEDSLARGLDAGQRALHGPGCGAGLLGGPQDVVEFYFFGGSLGVLTVVERH